MNEQYFENKALQLKNAISPFKLKQNKSIYLHKLFNSFKGLEFWIKSTLFPAWEAAGGVATLENNGEGFLFKGHTVSGAVFNTSFYIRNNALVTKTEYHVNTQDFDFFVKVQENTLFNINALFSFEKPHVSFYLKRSIDLIDQLFTSCIGLIQAISQPVISAIDVSQATTRFYTAIPAVPYVAHSQYIQEYLSSISSNSPCFEFFAMLEYECAFKFAGFDSFLNSYKVFEPTRKFREKDILIARALMLETSNILSEDLEFFKACTAIEEYDLLKMNAQTIDLVKTHLVTAGFNV